jgi:hypothetical protein
MIMKLAIDEDCFLSPIPAFIMDISPQFLNILGYDDLTNKYLPELVPIIHHTKIPQNSLKINVEQVEGLVIPKFQGKYKNAFLRHKNGHYIHLIINCITYFVKTKK